MVACVSVFVTSGTDAESLEIDEYAVTGVVC